MSVYVTNTHALLWYFTGQRRMLSKRAFEVFEQAERCEAFIYIQVVSLWEVSRLDHVGAIELHEPFDQEPEYLIEVFWRIGFIRAQAVGGVKALQRRGSRYLGQHQVANLNLRNISRFQVHPMFRSFLGMKEPRDKPNPGDEE